MEDKRIILHTREAEENEFVMQQTQLINSHFMKRVLDYVAANSNLDYEIMDRNNFVNRNRFGWRFIKKGNNSEWVKIGKINCMKFIR